MYWACSHARTAPAPGSGSGAAERGRGALCRVSPWAGGVQRLFWPAHSPGAATDRPHGGACLVAQVGRLGMQLFRYFSDTARA